MKNYKNAIFYLMIPILLTCGVFASLLIDRNSSLREAENKAKTVLTDSAREQTKFFQTRIQAQFAILEAFAELISTKETLDLARFDEVAGYIAKSGDFYHVGVVSSVDGIAHVHTHDSFSAVDRNYFKQALAGKQQIELVIENRVDSVPLFVFSTPMYQNGKIVAVAFGSYDMRKFISLLNSQSYGGASYSYVCDSMGNLIIRSESDTFLLGTNSG
ncbi:MAG: cache domain-containing protein, partial [Clostridia bacterium]